MAIEKRIIARRGFTIMELLVVIAIIMTLIGILVPGIRGVKRIAKNLEQKSLFHALEIGLETYRKDFEDYPESRTRGSGPYFTGAQHLAEAMVGRDSRGFEPMQAGKWYFPGDNSAPATLYTNDPKSKARRKKPYVNLKDTGAFLPGELYGTPTDAAVNSVVSYDSGTGQRAPWISDMFYAKKVTLGNGERIKVGSPILYYKANRSSDIFYRNPSNAPASEANTSKWKYNYNDNIHISDPNPGVGLAKLGDPNVRHELDKVRFYDSINDPTAPASSFPNGRPMNEDTYILISAGYDGIFGTKDDVTNIKIK